MDYLAKALAALDKGAANVKGQKASVMARPVAEQLKDFCRQDAEFAQAVAQGGSFADCMAAVVKGVGNSISDLDAYRKAVQFYFPGAEIACQMTIRVNPYEQAEPEQEQARGIVLDFSSLFF